MEHSEQQLADTLTEEPIVFMGCTGTEMTMVIGMSAGLCLPSGLIVGLMLTAMSPTIALLGGVMIAFGGAFVLSLFALNRLQTIKEQQGNNYYKEKLALYFSEMGIGEQVINRNQRYGRGRSL